ncbi:PAS domain-containing protein [Longitalea luteola]|uniref:PAS domain-containing protein n=1 Tax=Longitalea luteola TaxID=2812563 RepID=UPI001A960FDF|nr:PAS domain S-box protein [Longitalea luteola]
MFSDTDLCRLIIEHSNDMIIATDKNLQITMVNKVAEDKLGRAINDAFQKNLFYFFPEARYGSAIFQHLESVLKGRSLVRTFPMKKANQYFEWKIMPLHDTRDQLHGILCIIKDISNSVQQENRISELNRVLLEKQLLLNNRAKMAETIIDASNDLIMILDKKLVLAAVNKALSKCCGKTADELKGKNIFECFPNLKDSEVHLKINAAFDGTPSWIRSASDLVENCRFDIFITPFSFQEMVYGVLIIAHRLMRGESE